MARQVFVFANEKDAKMFLNGTERSINPDITFGQPEMVWRIVAEDEGTEHESELDMREQADIDPLQTELDVKGD